MMETLDNFGIILFSDEPIFIWMAMQITEIIASGVMKILKDSIDHHFTAERCYVGSGFFYEDRNER